MNQYTSVSPVEVGVMSGVIGAGIGYTLAPRKYNLEQLLTQKSDVFEKSFPKNVIEKAGPSQKIAYNTIVEGRNILEEAARTNTIEAKIAEFAGAPKYLKAYREIKGFLPKARIQTAIILGIIGGFAGVIGKIMLGEKMSSN